MGHIRKILKRIKKGKKRGINMPAKGKTATSTKSLEKKITNLGHELSEKTKQADEYLDHLQRMKAEFENYKKRAAKDQASLIEYANQDLILKLLDIVDNFDRAMEHKNEVNDVGEFITGIEMIQTQLNAMLSQEGVLAIEALGKTFDPTIHEAVMCVATNEHPDNIVIDEIKRGYMFKDKLIRPSMVKVSKNEC